MNLRNKVKSSSKPTIPSHHSIPESSFSPRAVVNGRESGTLDTGQDEAIRLRLDVWIYLPSKFTEPAKSRLHVLFKPTTPSQDNIRGSSFGTVSSEHGIELSPSTGRCNSHFFSRLPRFRQ